MKIKRWFENKILTEETSAYGGFIVEVLGVERETEKAYLLSITVGYSSDIEETITAWVPKSCTMTDEEYEQEQIEEQRRFDNGLAYNKSLVAYAKANKVKGVREGLKTKTLISKIQSAGLEVPARLQ